MLCNYEIEVLRALSKNEIHTIPYGAARNAAIETLRGGGYLTPMLLEPTEKAKPYLKH